MERIEAIEAVQFAVIAALRGLMQLQPHLAQQLLAQTDNIEAMLQAHPLTEEQIAGCRETYRLLLGA